MHQHRLCYVELQYLPLGCLPAALVGVCLLGLLAESCSTVGVLLAHGPLVGQVAGAVDDGHQRAYYRPVDRHV